MWCGFRVKPGMTVGGGQNKYLNSINLWVCYLDMTELLTTNIEDKIITIRGQQVMLDRDLAGIYQVETKVLNQAVKRNIEKFPTDFMFQLTKEEFENLKSQFVTSSWGGIRKLPFVFTEHGCFQASSVLKSDIAKRMSVFVVRAFVAMKHYLQLPNSSNELRGLIDRLERELVNTTNEIKLQQRIDTARQDKKIEQLSSEFGEIKQILNAFQDQHIIIKRPEDEGQG